jgi:arylsulfatase A-like enzyme
MDPPQSYLDLFPEETGDSEDGDADSGRDGQGDFITGGKKISAENLRLLYKKRRAYKAMVKLVDDQVGRIFSALEDEGILENTLILFTSDHGEMMGDHLKLQKQSWYKESVCVPAAIRHPGFLGKKVNHSPVELTDLTATILDAAGLDPRQSLSKDWPAFHDRVPCRSLLPIVRGETEQVRDFAFSECNGEWQMIFDGRWKYVRCLRYEAPGAAREELYDLSEDPQELVDRSADPSCAAILARARDRRDWVMDSTPPAQTRWAPLDPEGEAFSYPE